MTRGLAIAGKHRQEDAHKHGMGHSANLAYKKSDNPNSVRDKRKYSRMYEIVASALSWLIPDISPDAGMLRSGCPAPPLTKTGLNNPNQLKLGSLAPKCVGFCRGILGFTRWVPCDWANCSKSGIFAPILVGRAPVLAFSDFGNLVSGRLHAGKGVCFQHV